MRHHVARFVLTTFLLGCFACHGVESGEVLVVGFTNCLLITKVGTNDYYRDKLFRDLDKHTLDVKLDHPKDWRKNYDRFSAALVKEARAAGLEADSLEKLLKELVNAKENKGLAVIPVAVHQTRDSVNSMWIITLKWEVEGGSTLAHMRKFWFKRGSLKQLGFWTCA